MVTRLEDPACAAFRPRFYRVLCKILFMSYRFNLDEYIYDPQKLLFWMQLIGVVLTHPTQYPQALTQATKFLRPLIRNSKPEETEADSKYLRKGKLRQRSKEESEKMSRERNFHSEWRKAYVPKIAETLMNIVQTVAPTDGKDVQKYFGNIESCLGLLIESKDVGPRVTERLTEMFDKLFELTRMLPADVEEYTDNPSQFYERYHFPLKERAIRYSAVYIISYLLNSSQAAKILQKLGQKLQESAADPLTREACYYIIVKGHSGIVRIDKDFAMCSALINNFVVVDMACASGILKSQSMNALRFLLKNSAPSDAILHAVGGLMWANLEWPELPCRNFAILLLSEILRFDAIKTQLATNAETLIRVVMEALKTSQHESIISVLSDIAQAFPKELSANVLVFLTDTMAVANKLLNDLNNPEADDGDEEEDHTDIEFSVFQIFEAIQSFISIPTTPEVHLQMVLLLDPFISSVLAHQNTEFDIEMLQMVANLVHMAAPGQVPPALWKYFEFAVLSLSSLDLKAQFGNKLLELLKQNVENYNECIQYSIELIVNFSAREPQRVLGGVCETGHSYPDLILQFYTAVAKLSSDDIDENHKVRNSMLLPKLLVCFREIAPGQPAAFVPTAFKQTLAFEGFDVEVLEANMIHNIGCLFLAAPFPVYELVVALHAQNPQLKMMAKWLAAHRRCIASDVRRASFLGLCSVLSNWKKFPLLFEEVSVQSLVLFLLCDLVYIDLQIEREDEEESDDMDIDDFDDEDTDLNQYADVTDNVDYSKLLPERLVSYFEDLAQKGCYSIQIVNGNSIFFEDPVVEVDYVAVFKHLLSELIKEHAELGALVGQALSPEMASYTQKILNS